MTARSMSVGVSLGRFTLRAMPRRSRRSATVRRWTPNSRARSSNERPCWYSATTAATSEGVSRRWTGFVGRRAAPPGVGESTSSTSARSALEPGFECCPLLFGSPAPGRFEDRLAAFCGFRPTAGPARNPWSGAVSRVSGGFESRPQRSTHCQNHIVRPVQGALRASDRSGTFGFYFKPPYQAPASQVMPERARLPSASPEGSELGSSQRTEELIGQVQGQFQQVFPNAVAYVLHLQLEPVHDAEHGSIGGFGETRLGHGPALGCDECGVHPEHLEDGFKRLRESLG